MSQLDFHSPSSMKLLPWVKLKSICLNIEFQVFSETLCDVMCVFSLFPKVIPKGRRKIQVGCFILFMQIVLVGVLFEKKNKIAVMLFIFECFWKT